ncbi:MAG: hypothetical protein WD768_09700 [Phycisphaeraceae bacterium]
MRHITSLALLAVTLVAGGCGGGSHEAVAEESVSKFKELASVLEGVTDTASAKAAKPKIDAIVAELKAIGERSKALPEPDEATKKKIMEKMKTELTSAMMKMQEAMMKLATNPEAAKALGEAMEKMQDLK